MYLIKYSNLILALLLVTGACKKQDDEPSSIITGRSECLGFKEGSNHYSYFTYSYDTLGKTLKFKHLNAGFNCCPDEIYATFSRKSDSIYITESEKEAGCSCLCLYELNMEIENMSRKTYYFRFSEPYTNGNSMKFGLNLQDSVSGTFRMHRDYYPWGLENYF